MRSSQGLLDYSVNGCGNAYRVMVITHSSFQIVKVLLTSSKAIHSEKGGSGKSSEGKCIFIIGMRLRHQTLRTTACEVKTSDTWYRTDARCVDNSKEWKRDPWIQF